MPPSSRPKPSAAPLPSDRAGPSPDKKVKKKKEKSEKGEKKKKDKVPASEDAVPLASLSLAAAANGDEAPPDARALLAEVMAGTPRGKQPPPALSGAPAAQSSSAAAPAAAPEGAPAAEPASARTSSSEATDTDTSNTDRSHDDDTDAPRTSIAVLLAEDALLSARAGPASMHGDDAAPVPVQ